MKSSSQRINDLQDVESRIRRKKADMAWHERTRRSWSISDRMRATMFNFGRCILELRDLEVDAFRCRQSLAIGDNFPSELRLSADGLPEEGDADPLDCGGPDWRSREVLENSIRILKAVVGIPNMVMTTTEVQKQLLVPRRRTSSWKQSGSHGYRQDKGGRGGFLVSHLLPYMQKRLDRAAGRKDRKGDNSRIPPRARKRGKPAISGKKLG